MKGTLPSQTGISMSCVSLNEREFEMGGEIAVIRKRNACPENSKQINHQSRQEGVVGLLFFFFFKYPLPICFTQFENFSQEENTLVKCLISSKDELDLNFWMPCSFNGDCRSLRNERILPACIRTSFHLCGRVRAVCSTKTSVCWRMTLVLNFHLFLSRIWKDVFFSKFSHFK